MWNATLGVGAHGYNHMEEGEGGSSKWELGRELNRCSTANLFEPLCPCSS